MPHWLQMLEKNFCVDSSSWKSTSNSSVGSSRLQSLPGAVHSPERLGSHKKSVLTNLMNETPPPIPKRKFSSVGVGDSIPVDDIVCYSKKELKTRISTSPEFNPWTGFSSGIDGFKIDAELGVLYPLHLKELNNQDKKSPVNASTQTNSAALRSSHTHTKTSSSTNEDVACGADYLSRLIKVSAV